jgi:hypothetical protein
MLTRRMVCAVSKARMSICSPAERRSSASLPGPGGHRRHGQWDGRHSPRSPKQSQEKQYPSRLGERRAMVDTVSRCVSAAYCLTFFLVSYSTTWALKQYPSLRPRTGDSAGGFLTYSAASSSAEVDPLSGVSAWGYSAQAYGAEGKGRDRRENPWGILFSARKKRAYDRPRTPRSPRAILGGSVPCVHRCADF